MSRNKSNAVEETLGNTMGTSTGGTEHSTVSGGWTGTDDATSTSVDDRTGLARAEDAESAERVLEEMEEAASFQEEKARDRQAEIEELQDLADRGTD